MLLALGWVVHRLDRLSSARAASDTHNLLGTHASALSEQDLSRSAEVAWRVSRETQYKVF
jgi:hypothetical protein